METLYEMTRNMDISHASFCVAASLFAQHLCFLDVSRLGIRFDVDFLCVVGGAGLACCILSRLRMWWWFSFVPLKGHSVSVLQPGCGKRTTIGDHSHGTGLG